MTAIRILANIIMTLVQLLVHVMLCVVPCVSMCEDGKCLTGGYYFAVGRDTVDNHALVGHVIENVTVTDPIGCFEKCRGDCRCISFNFQTTLSQKNCQLNNENINTIPVALKQIKGSQYYHLVINYNNRADTQSSECTNGCCKKQNQSCLNDGMCYETCDVTKERFTCSCTSCFGGKYCETPKCPTGWLLFNSSCFKEFRPAMNWTDAKQACESLNSSLTSIHSAEEGEFIASHVVSADTTTFSFGFNDIENEGTWEWVDGSDVTFTNWMVNQPDDYRQNQDCGLIFLNSPRTNLWDDNNCGAVRRYVCRKGCA